MSDLATLRILVDLDGSGVAPKAAAITGAVRGMEAGVSGAFGRMRAATTGVSGEFDRLATRTGSASSAIAGAFRGLSTTEKALIGAGAGAILLGTALAASIRPAIEFESAFAGVEKTVDGTPGQLADIREGLLDLSAAIPTAAKDLADIAANAGQLGVEAPKVVAFTKTIALLGETTDLSFESAAQSLARFLNVTGNTAPIDRIGDVIVQLGNNSATTESQIVSFASRLAASFTVAGATEDEILAVAAAFSSMGVQAEAGGSSLSRIITQIADAAKIGGSDLQTFADTAGVTTEQFAALAKESPVEAFVLFAEGLGEVAAEGRSLSPTLKALELDGIRTKNVMELAALNTDQLRVSLGLAKNEFAEGGAAAAEANKRFETTASRLEVLRNRINRVAIEFGTPALGLFARGADLAGDAIEALVEILRPLGTLGLDVFRQLGLAVNAFYDVLGQPALEAFGASLVGATTTATGFLGALTATGPAGVALTGLLGTLTIYPGILATAASTAAGFADSVRQVGIRAATAQTATQTLGAVASSTAGRILILSAAFAAIGKAQRDAAAEGERFARVYTDQLDKAIEAPDFDAARRAVEQLQAAKRNLDAEIDNNTTELWGRQIRDVSGTVDVLVGYLPGFTSEVLENEAAFRALSAATEDVDYSTLEEDIGRVALNLGISEEAVFRYAQELGVLPDLVSDSAEAHLAARDAIYEAAEAHAALADANQVLADKVFAGNGTLSDYADLLGVTEEALVRLAGRLDIDIESIIGEDDPEKIGEFVDGVEALTGQYELLGAAIGLTGPQYEAELGLIEDLTAAHSTLRSTIDGTISSYELIQQQQERVNEATANYEEALSSISDIDTLTTAAGALRTLSTEFAGSGVSADEAALAQARWALAVRQAGLDAGIAEEDVDLLVSTLGLIDPVYLSEISVEGQAAFDKTSEVEGKLIKLGDSIFTATLDANGELVLQEVEKVAAALEGYTRGEYLAKLLADGRPADEAVEESRQRALDYSDGDYYAKIGADNEDATKAIERSFIDARTYADAEYLATLRADAGEALEETEGARSSGRDYADSDYTASLDAYGLDAREEIDATKGRADDYDDEYVARLLILNNDNTSAQLKFRRLEALEYDGDYQARLGVDDKANEPIRKANEQLGRFNSKSITITANYIGRSSGSFAPSAVPVNVRRHGGIDWPGLSRFEDGGLAVLDPVAAVVGAGVKADPRSADIHSAATPYRVFAEPAAGWEAFIPQYGDRGRNRAIWERTGKLLGFMERGGIASPVKAYQDGGITGQLPLGGGGSSVQINAPIQIDMTQLPPNADIGSVAAMFEAKLQQAFADMARTIANTP